MGWWLGSIAVVSAGVWWLRRFLMEADGHYERDYRDPPITDITDRLGGGGF
jgi:hypothetical protein